MKRARAMLLALLWLPMLLTGGCAAEKESHVVKYKEEVPVVEQNPIVTIVMDDDSVIKAELYPNTAYVTVANFVLLIQEGFYDGVGFHRIVPGFMIQGGDPEGTGMGGPGYGIYGEFLENGYEGNDIPHTRGTLSMARRSNDMDSAGSQFFIMVADASFLNRSYAAFGKVIEGMEVADEIVSAPASQEMALEPRIMKQVTVETFGVEYSLDER